MIEGVRISNQGVCEKVKFGNRNNTLHYNNQNLCVHFSDDTSGLCIVSTKSIDSLLNDDDILTFSLPPPLNTYIYPSDVFCVKFVANKWESLSVQDFQRHCQDFVANVVKIDKESAIYDVPLQEDPVEECEVESEDEEEDYGCEEEDDIEEEGEEDWEVDDDEPA